MAPDAGQESTETPIDHDGLFGDLDGDGRIDAHERFELLRDAAIQAEFDTGIREETEAAAKRHVLMRIGTIVVGFIVLIAGLAMLVLPGQGIITVIIGLTILARELPWAERMLEYAKRKAKVDELKQQPVWVKAVAWGFTVVAIAVSAWYMFIADPKPALAEILPWNW
ncbi:MAG: PGPGW domain-containing protein [Acidimicrobiales bacterium]|nr:PGPGW domain-containing protein [Acidimicrobiales bacterium]